MWQTWRFHPHCSNTKTHRKLVEQKHNRHLGPPYSWWSWLQPIKGKGVVNSLPITKLQRHIPSAAGLIEQEKNTRYPKHPFIHFLYELVPDVRVTGVNLGPRCSSQGHMNTDNHPHSHLGAILSFQLASHAGFCLENLERTHTDTEMSRAWNRTHCLVAVWRHIKQGSTKKKNKHTLRRELQETEKSISLRLLLFDRNSLSGSCKFFILYSGSICHKVFQLKGIVGRILEFAWWEFPCKTWRHRGSISSSTSSCFFCSSSFILTRTDDYQDNYWLTLMLQGTRLWPRSLCLSWWNIRTHISHHHDVRTQTTLKFIPLA